MHLLLCLTVLLQRLLWSLYNRPLKMSCGRTVPLKGPCWSYYLQCLPTSGILQLALHLRFSVPSVINYGLPRILIYTSQASHQHFVPKLPLDTSIDDIFRNVQCKLDYLSCSLAYTKLTKDNRFG